MQRGARRRSHHGLLHGDDLLTVDLPQSPGVAFQSSLQATPGLEEKTEQVDDPQSQLQRKTKLRLYTFFYGLCCHSLFTSSEVIPLAANTSVLFRLKPSTFLLFVCFWSEVVVVNFFPPHVSCDS